MISPEQVEQYQALSDRIEAMRKDVDKVERERAELVAHIIRDTILAGVWKIDTTSWSESLVPANRDTEKMLDKMIASAFRLGHHGSGNIKIGEVDINARIDDGRVHLYVSLSSKVDPAKALEESPIKIEETSLVAYLKGEYEQKLDFKERDLGTLEREVSALREKIAELEKSLEQ